MNLPIIIASAKKKKYLTIKKEELKILLDRSKILVEKDTYISDKIRLLKYEDELFIQEKSNKDEYLIRLMKTKKEAEEFIKQRLEIYDSMWDGCGCKVQYYD
ncbi:MAG: hypothetical protein OEM46_07500 [Ignavibacteria bacterium]|nr:hypothetical protein [Ignavibacteria bacterium]